MGLFPVTTPKQIDLARDVREDVEIAIVDRLVCLRRDKGGMVGMIREYAGELDRWQDEVTPEDIKRAVAGQIPSILVAASEARYESASTGRNRYRAQLDVELLHVAASLRSREARERGGEGVFRVMGHVRALLSGKDLGIPDCGAFQPVAESPMLHTTDLCVWKQTFSAAINSANIPPPEGTVITSLFSSGMVAEISGVGDSLAFAAGAVTLTDAAGGFHRELLGLSIVIAGATTPANNGTFPITDIPDAGEGTQIKFTNAAGVTETFSGTWTIKRTTPLIQASSPL